MAYLLYKVDAARPGTSGRWASGASASRTPGISTAGPGRRTRRGYRPAASTERGTR
ncbi:hypothetical protein V2I01_32030 [Micromonospora sp. BRA006-A]|nr:hypothetical protein [Micromonospora sp. BRA006-A]